MRAALLLVLAGCCPVAIVGEDVDPPPGADEAIELIHAEYMAAFESERREVEVQWVASIDGEDGRGVSFSCRDIWIAAADSDAPSDTNLAHEVAHCYAGHVPASGCVGHYDNSHTEAWIWGEPGVRPGIVSETRALMAAAGL
jgi:hypothetical protein